MSTVEKVLSVVVYGNHVTSVRWNKIESTPFFQYSLRSSSGTGERVHIITDMNESDFQFQRALELIKERLGNVFIEIVPSK